MSAERSLPRIREFDHYDWFATRIYRSRSLPHWELQGSTYFITARVAPEVGEPFHDVQVATTMISSLLHDHNKKYLIYAYVVMPDHLHIIMKPLSGNRLAKIMQGIKGSSAYAMNKQLERAGRFWQAENFDHLICDDSNLREKWEYIKENPVKAKLVSKAEDYPFSSFFVRDTA